MPLTTNIRAACRAEAFRLISGEVLPARTEVDPEFGTSR